MHQIGSCHVVYGDDVETLAFDWGNVKLLSTPALGGGAAMTFGMVVLQPGQGHERHNHPDADEILFILSGEGDQMLDDEEPVRVRAGASIYVPRGVYHSTMNAGWEPLRFVVVYAPAGPEHVLRGLPGVRIVPAGRIA
jgi:oxalate decarboxylase/phosphoglucose isomerase-like protein (cupin superfamily)